MGIQLLDKRSSGGVRMTRANGYFIDGAYLDDVLHVLATKNLLSNSCSVKHSPRTKQNRSGFGVLLQGYLEAGIRAIEVHDSESSRVLLFK